MSFFAKIFVDDQEREVLNSDYIFHKTKDLYGQPDSQALGGQLDIALESTDHDHLWYDWMLSDNVRKKGHIRFYNRDSLSKLYDFEFWDCYCTGLHESFRSTGTIPMTLQLSLSPGIFRIRDYVFEKSWKISEPFSKNRVVTGRNEEEREPVEPRITGAFVNTTTLSPDNKCKNCASIHALGKNFLPARGFHNGIEIQFTIADWPSDDVDNPYRLSIKRQIVSRRVAYEYENAAFNEDSAYLNDGPNPINVQLTPVNGKIYSIDGPGFEHHAIARLDASIIVVKQIGNFIETATLTCPGKKPSDFSIQWHTKLKIKRDQKGIFQYDMGEIGSEHIEISKFSPQRTK